MGGGIHSGYWAVNRLIGNRHLLLEISDCPENKSHLYYLKNKTKQKQKTSQHVSLSKRSKLYPTTKDYRVPDISFLAWDFWMRGKKHKDTEI